MKKSRFIGRTQRRLRRVVEMFSPTSPLPGRPPLEQTPMLDGKTFCFLGGLHRSGTSILHRLMREHPSVSGFSGTHVQQDEGQHLQTVFPPAIEYGGPGRFAFDPRAALTEASPLIIEENRNQLLREWGAYYEMGKRVFLEKSPPNLIRARFFQALFPGAHFVFIVRHPVAVALATQKWSYMSLVEMLLHWHIAHQKILADLPHLQHAILFRYEDFVQTPDAYLEHLCQWLQLEKYTPQEQVIDVNSKYFSLLEETLHYQQELQLFAEHFPEVVQSIADFGYTLESPVLNPCGLDSLLLKKSSPANT